ncbi:MAG: hypothetical protein JWQ98_2540 [Chlorobi bacterium]|jgi:uncharacterized protein (DUF697 family)|nr:hypothetical protein [Chlorobiota bacterium]
MNGKKILSIIIAIVLGFVAVKILFAVIGFVFSAMWVLVGALIFGVVAFALYKGFNNMLSSGKRLT